MQELHPRIQSVHNEKAGLKRLFIDEIYKLIIKKEKSKENNLRQIQKGKLGL